MAVSALSPPAPANPPRRVDVARRRFGTWALASDLVALGVAAAALAAVSPTASPTGEVPTTPLVWVVLFSLTVLGFLAAANMYSAPFRLDVLDAIRSVAAQTALAATSVMAVRVLTQNDPYVAAETVRHWLIVLPLVALGRSAVLFAEARVRRSGAVGTATLIVGAGRIGQLTARRLTGQPELGLRPVGFLDDDPLADDEPGVPVLGGMADFERIAADQGVRHVIIGFSRAAHEDLLHVARSCWALGISVSVVPRLFEIEGERVAMEHLGGLPLVQLRPADPYGWKFRIKYAVDRVVAGAMLLALAPVLLAAAVAVRLSLGSPVLFRQWRVGRDGHGFEILKFRTLEGDPRQGGEADAAWAGEQLGRPVADVVADRRTTPMGRALRATCVDELPQLWNVVRGDMSLVGPRPERLTYVEHFQGDVYRYTDRHRVKSGLTGWAQVHGLRGPTSLADRIEFDNHYIENWSLWLDLKILAKTIPAVLRAVRA